MANSRMDHKTTPGQDIGQGPSLPTIKLPKGGGAIQNIGEKFGMSPVTGTGSFSIPISTTPARAVVRLEYVGTLNNTKNQSRSSPI